MKNRPSGLIYKKKNAGLAIHEMLSYNKDTGEVRWLIDRQSTRAGDLAGWKTQYGYMCVMINKKQYCLHRITWFLTYGVFPKQTIDHINGIRHDNRIANLRDVSQRTNCCNRIEHRRNKLVGVMHKSDRKTKKWSSVISINGERKYLGTFNTEQEAHNAYMKAFSLQEGLVSDPHNSNK